MKKIVISIFILLISTGCTIKYDLVIDNNKKVYENSNIINDITNKREEVINYINGSVDYYKNNDNFQHYQIENKTKLSKMDVNLKSNYETLSEFANSQILSEIFGGAAITQEGNITKFETNDNYNYYVLFPDFTEPELRIEDIKISIKFYNNVVNSNADKVDKFSNTYTWNITSEDKSKKILFSINNTVRYDIMVIEFCKNNIFQIILGILILISIMIIIFRFYLINKKNNEL